MCYVMIFNCKLEICIIVNEAIFKILLQFEITQEKENEDKQHWNTGADRTGTGLCVYLPPVQRCTLALSKALWDKEKAARRGGGKELIACLAENKHLYSGPRKQIR